MKIITVEAPIGVGKTTYIINECKRLNAQGIKAKAVYELKENESDSISDEVTTRDKITDILLKIYYDNLDNLSSDNEFKRTQSLIATLAHQMLFLTNRATKILESIKIAEEQGVDVLFLDRTILADIIFTKLNLFNEPLYGDKYNVVGQAQFNVLNKVLNRYDRENILLTVPFEIAYERIKKRGREMEQEPELKEYFEELHNKYEMEIKSNMDLVGGDYTIIDNA